ncbi:unannotated protein [freshwater metagenome]|jgi:hypothetical protein|uniref:Unannotated protein n=1 Tax=freshwater metagenome TaxID=449393 RepID=A0A6J6TYZ9_9ZZZZ|nr:hypothetical protein [Actinomycetota bacterium]MSX19811.1 hypothetical protein [Actinomycetota bacterium]MSX70887.1 hypothetical protein [Actinomycetota bacterium]MSY93668.1 hypothetical protein [Actinomycetota bacterium]
MRSRTKHVEAEDASPLAGWMYADLLLALMVIFLATISFVPNLANSSAAVTTQIKQISSGYNYNKGLSLVYNGFNSALIADDIANFKRSEGLPADAEIIYAQILGGFDVKTENPDDGKLRALEFSIKLSKNSPQLFATAATNLGSNLVLKPDEIALRLTFVAKIK